jgi:hypothetical protein
VTNPEEQNLDEREKQFEQGTTPPSSNSKSGHTPSSRNASSTQEEDKSRSTPPQDSRLVEGDPAYPMVPITAASSDKAVLSVLVNPSVMEALAQDAPQEVLKFAEASDDRQFRYYMQREQNRHKELVAREATTRIAIGAVMGSVFGAFIYSAFTGDTNLSSQIISVIVGGFGGLGISKLLQSKEEE